MKRSRIWDVVIVAVILLLTSVTMTVRESQYLSASVSGSNTSDEDDEEDDEDEEEDDEDNDEDEEEDEDEDEADDDDESGEVDEDNQENDDDDEGTPSITDGAAMEVVMQKAGITSADIIRRRVEYKDGDNVFEVKLETVSMEVTARVNAENAEIVRIEIKRREDNSGKSNEKDRKRDECLRAAGEDAEKREQCTQCITVTSEDGEVEKVCPSDGSKLGTCMREAAGDPEKMKVCFDESGRSHEEGKSPFSDSLSKQVRECLTSATTPVEKHQCFLDEAKRRFAHLSPEKQERLLREKQRMLEELEKIEDIEEESSDSEEVSDDLDELLDDIENYDFTESAGADVRKAIQALEDDGKITKEEVVKLRATFKAAKERARKEKHSTGVIPFEDTDTDNEFLSYIDALKEQGIVSGVDGKFFPDKEFSRGEITKVALRAAGVEADTASNKGSFTDVSSTYSLRSYVEKAKELGIVKGNAGKFNPDRSVTRLEALQIVLKAMGITPTPTMSTTFADMQRFSAQEKAFVEYARTRGIISSGTSFRPNDPISRQEMAKIVTNAVEIVE